MFRARIDGYANPDAFDRYLHRAEVLISAYDETMLQYSANLARRG